MMFESIVGTEFSILFATVNRSARFNMIAHQGARSPRSDNEIANSNELAATGR